MWLIIIRVEDLFGIDALGVLHLLAGRMLCVKVELLRNACAVCEPHLEDVLVNIGLTGIRGEWVTSQDRSELKASLDLMCPDHDMHVDRRSRFLIRVVSLDPFLLTNSTDDADDLLLETSWRKLTLVKGCTQGAVLSSKCTVTTSTPVWSKKTSMAMIRWTEFI